MGSVWFGEAILQRSPHVAPPQPAGASIPLSSMGFFDQTSIIVDQKRARNPRSKSNAPCGRACHAGGGGQTEKC